LRIGIIGKVTLIEQVSLYHTFVYVTQKVFECTYRACGTSRFVALDAGIKLERFAIIEYLNCEARCVVGSG